MPRGFVFLSFFSLPDNSFSLTYPRVQYPHAHVQPAEEASGTMWDMLDAMFRASPDAPITPTASGGAGGGGYDPVTGAPLAAGAGAAQQDPSAPQFSPSGAFLAAGAAAGANKVRQRIDGCCFIHSCWPLEYLHPC